MRRVQTILVATILAATTILTATFLTATSLTRADDPFRLDDVRGDDAPQPFAKSVSVTGKSSDIPAGGNRAVPAVSDPPAWVLEAPTTTTSQQRFGQPVSNGLPGHTSLTATRDESTARNGLAAGTPPAAVNPFLMSEAPPAPNAAAEGAAVHAESPVPGGQRASTSGFFFADDSPVSSDSPAARAAAASRLTEAIPTMPITKVNQSPTAQAATPVRGADPLAGPDVGPPHIRSDEQPIRSDEQPIRSDEKKTRSTIQDPRTDAEHELAVVEGESLRHLPTEPYPAFDSEPAVQAPAAPLGPATMTSPAYSHDATIVTAAWRTKGPFNVGQKCPCEIVVKNQCGTMAEQVRVETSLPPSLRIVSSVPPPSQRDGVVSWQLQDLAPGEQQTIKVMVIAEQPGPVEVAAHVRYTASQVQSLTVAEPKLQVALNGPTDVSVGEPASQTVVIHNPGTGVATNIVLEALVPPGLEHVSGKDLVMQIGSLNPGETRQFRLALAAVDDGSQILKVEARAGAGLVETATAKINVLAPQLRASIEGPGLRYLGREATYVLGVENEGVAATDAVQMVYGIPEGFEFLRSDRGAQFDEATGTLRWFVGRIGPHQPQELRVTLLATRAGEFVQKVVASSEHGTATEAQMTTRVEGTASLVMKVADLDDPIEIGTDTAYEIMITNEGTAGAQQIILACQMPKGLAFVQASGPSGHRTQANTILFEPVATLQAGESVRYRIHVRGTVAGDKRFRCRLTSTELSQPLFTEESTKFYGE